MAETPDAPLPPAGRSWHYGAAGRPIGPVPEAVFVQMLQSGQVTAGTLVWTDGMSDWVAARSVPGFAPHARHTPPTSPQAIPPPAATLGDSAGVRLLLPVGRSPWAIVAGYLGLLGLIPGLGVLLAPAAVLCGVLAIRDIKRDPRRHGMGRAVTGIVLGLLGIVGAVLLLTGVLFRF
jgi:hypothetical protein